MAEGGDPGGICREARTLKAQLKGDADTRLEVHKASLKAAGDVELERLRSQLAATAVKRNTLLNALTTRRFEAMAAIHASLLKFHIALGRLTAVQLGRVNAHAFRHTFASQSVADEVAMDVVHQVLGHVSVQTTTKYV